MKKLLFFALLLILNSSLRSQLSYQWAGKAGSTVSEYGQAIASDPSGNVYVAGSFSGTVDFDPGPGTTTLAGLSGSTDIFLAKYSSAGAFIWVKQIGSTSTEKAYDLAVDATGPYLAGTFMGNCNFNIGGVTSTLTSLGGGTDGDGFFARYDVNGNLTWVDRIGSTGNDRVIGIAVDASQNVFVSGFIGANADMDPGPGTTIFTVSATYNAYFAKYTSAGALTFAKQIVGSYSEADDIAIDATGNIYLTGSFSQTNDFDPAPGFTVNLTTSSPTQLDIFLAKYTTLGAFTFVKQIGGIGTDIGFQVKPDASGNIYLGGVFSATCDFNPAPGFTNSIVSAGQGDLFVGKYDVSGNYIWANGTGGTTNDYCYGLGLDASNNVYITGNCNGANIDFDSGPGVSALTSTSSSFYIASYNSAGAFSFVNSLGNIPSDGKGLTVNSSVYITGMFSATGDFDFGVPSATLTSAGGSDVFFAKYNACFGAAPAQPGAISGTNAACAGSVKTYSVVNDPAATAYVWTLPGGWTGTSTTNIITATVGTTGTISVVATGTCGSSPAQTLAITVNPLPVANASNNSPVCAWSSILFSSSGGVSYAWAGPNGFTQAIQNPTIVNCAFFNAGQYTVIVTSAAGCTAVALTNVTVMPLPSPNIVSNTPNCVGSTLTFTGSGGGTYNWFGPNSFTSSVQNPTIGNVSMAANGTYTLVVSNGSCSNSVTHSVTVSAFPTPTATNNSPVCVNQQINFLSGGGMTYTWTGPGGFTSNSQNPIIAIAQSTNAGNYTITVTNFYGCSNSGTTNVVVNPLPAATASNNGLVCVGSPINLTSSGGVAYSWSGPGGYASSAQNPTITNAQVNYSGAYTVMVTSAQGCTANAVTNVSVSPAPSPSITSNSPVCTGGVLNLSASGSGTFNWSGPNSFTSNIQNPLISNVQVANAGNYSVIVTVGSCSASTSASITVFSSPTLTAVANNTLICAGQSSTLTASGANTYTWTGAGAGASIVVSPTITSTYTVTGTSTNNCTGSTVRTITVNPAPTINAVTNNSLLCIGQSATLTASGANTYTWTGAGTGATIAVSPTITSTYTVTGTGTNNCTGSAVKTITVNPAPIINATTNNSLLCIGQSATLTATGAASYSWTGGGNSATEIVSPTVTTNYTVTATGTNNCTGTAVVTQSVSSCVGLYTTAKAENEMFVLFPNPFADLVSISIGKLNGTVRMSVINALGQVVFSKQINETSSTINLSDLPKGIYFVKLNSDLYPEKKLKLVKE